MIYLERFCTVLWIRLIAGFKRLRAAQSGKIRANPSLVAFKNTTTKRAAFHTDYIIANQPFDLKARNCHNALPQVLSNEAKACKSPEAEPSHSSVDSLANRKYDPIQRQAKTLAQDSHRYLGVGIVGERWNTRNLRCLDAERGVWEGHLWTDGNRALKNSKAGVNHCHVKILELQNRILGEWNEIILWNYHIAYTIDSWIL